MDDNALRGIVATTALNFFNDLMAEKPTDDQMRDAHATLMMVMLDTISDNTNPREAMRVMVNIMTQFCKDKPGINLMVQEIDTPPRSAMQ